MSRVGPPRQLLKSGLLVIVLVLALGAMVYLILAHRGEYLAAQSAITLEQYLIQATGLLIAFTGIIFTGMLAEVRFRIERAAQGSDRIRQVKLEKTSKSLRMSALGGFVFFSSALAVAIVNLAIVLAATGPVSEAYVFVLPILLMVSGLVLLMIALALVALMQ